MTLRAKIGYKKRHNMMASDYISERDRIAMRDLDAGGFLEPVWRAFAKRISELDALCDPPRTVDAGSFETDARGILMEKRGINFLKKLVEANRKET